MNDKSGFGKMFASASLHDKAMFWVQDKTKGILNHVGIRHIVPQNIEEVKIFANFPYQVMGSEPDIVENVNKPQSTHRYHEVAVLKLKDKKLDRYSQDSHYKTLWIVLPPQTSDAFNSIRIIEQCESGFSEYKVVGGC